MAHGFGCACAHRRGDFNRRVCPVHRKQLGETNPMRLLAPSTVRPNDERIRDSQQAGTIRIPLLRPRPELPGHDEQSSEEKQKRHATCIVQGKLNPMVVDQKVQRSTTKKIKTGGQSWAMRTGWNGLVGPPTLTGFGLSDRVDNDGRSPPRNWLIARTSHKNGKSSLGTFPTIFSGRSDGTAASRAEYFQTCSTALQLEQFHGKLLCPSIYCP